MAQDDRMELTPVGIVSPYSEDHTNASQEITPERSNILVRSLGEMARKARTLAVIGVAAVGAGAELAQAADARVITDPIRYAGQPMPCPDPSVVKEPWNSRVLFAACTSDYGQLNPTRNGGLGRVGAAFPIYESDNGGFNWRFLNYVIRPGHSANGGRPPQGNWPGPRYWAPELRYNDDTGKWNVYFTTSMPSGQMALFAGWTHGKNIAGKWQTRRLHYKGQFNNVPGNPKEGGGGLIDPTVQKDPKTGQLDIAYCDQPNQIWIGSLQKNGIYMNDRVRRISYANQPWEGGVEEGPVLFWNPESQTMNMFVNTDSTWKGNYKVAFEASTDPLNAPWYKYSRPILRSGDGLYGPGMGSKPIKEGNRYFVYYHEQWPRPSHYSQRRYLARSPFSFTSRHAMYLPDGSSDSNTSSNPNLYFYDKQSKKYLPESDYASAQGSSTSSSSHEVYEKVVVPRIGNGYTQRRYPLS